MSFFLLKAKKLELYPQTHPYNEYKNTPYNNLQHNNNHFNRKENNTSCFTRNEECEIIV